MPPEPKKKTTSYLPIVSALRSSSLLQITRSKPPWRARNPVRKCLGGRQGSTGRIQGASGLHLRRHGSKTLRRSQHRPRSAMAKRGHDGSSWGQFWPPFGLPLGPVLAPNLAPFRAPFWTPPGTPPIPGRAENLMKTNKKLYGPGWYPMVK